MSGRLAQVFVVLLACAFIGGFVAGEFVVTVHAQGVACGAPLEVIDGSFANGVPDDLRNECQDAANRWIGLSLIPFSVLFVLTFFFTLRSQLKREEKEPRLLDGSDLL